MEKRKWRSSVSESARKPEEEIGVFGGPRVSAAESGKLSPRVSTALSSGVGNPFVLMIPNVRGRSRTP